MVLCDPVPLTLKVTDFPLEVESPSARIAVCRISLGFAVPVRKLEGRAFPVYHYILSERENCTTNDMVVNSFVIVRARTVLMKQNASIKLISGDRRYNHSPARTLKCVYFTKSLRETRASSKREQGGGNHATF